MAGSLPSTFEGVAQGIQAGNQSEQLDINQKQLQLNQQGQKNQQQRELFATADKHLSELMSVLEKTVEGAKNSGQSNQAITSNKGIQQMLSVADRLSTSAGGDPGRVQALFAGYLAQPGFDPNSVSAAPAARSAASPAPTATPPSPTIGKPSSLSEPVNLTDPRVDTIAIDKGPTQVLQNGKVVGEVPAQQPAQAGSSTAPGASNLEAANSQLKMTPQERALYERHLQNLTGPGGVDNKDGSRSSLYQSVQEHNGRFYNIPTVWNGRIETQKWRDPKNGKVWDVPNKAALANVEREGWDKFPSYSTPEEADARYEKMHQFMEKDTAAVLSGRQKQSSASNAAPAPQDDVEKFTHALIMLPPSATDTMKAALKERLQDAIAQKNGNVEVKVVKDENQNDHIVFVDKKAKTATDSNGNPYIAPTGGESDARAISDAIVSGKQPPVLTGLYKNSKVVRAELARSGFDLSSAQMEWDGAKKQIQALNGPQMTRYAGLAKSVVNTIDEVKSLSVEMQNSGVPLLNAAKLQTYIQTQGNSENGQLAARYLAGVNTLKEEFANLAQGGYAPTEAAWKLANDQINGNYGVQQLGASLNEVQRLIRYRLQGIPNFATRGPDAPNRYGGSSKDQSQAPVTKRYQFNPATGELE